MRQDHAVTAAPSDVTDSLLARKSRGAFFTPQPLCQYIADWAVRGFADRVLEPSCGEAAFLVAAAERARTLAAVEHRTPDVLLHGVEVHLESAVRANESVRRAVSHRDSHVEQGDFFSLEVRPNYDAVIGNPPFIRYQQFTGDHRARSRAAALRGGVALTGLASSWAAFTVHASLFLKPGGRLGLVLPAELLTVNYAAQVRAFLMRRFQHVRLVLFTERVFPGVLEEVVVLLADGFDNGPTDHCELLQVRNLHELPRPSRKKWKPVNPAGKWTPSLIGVDAAAVANRLHEDQHFTLLRSWGATRLGMVTGNNRYFSMSPAVARTLDLPASDVVPLSPPGSRHLRNLSFSRDDWDSLGASHLPTYLFRPSDKPSAAAWRYIETGEKRDVQQAYKCRVRKPWWLVPHVPKADLLLTYMNADTPRLCANLAEVYHLNSVHGLYLRAELKQLGMEVLPIASLNSATRLGAETVGRAYGGGMLKLEPKEADLLPVPTPAVVAASRFALTAIKGDVMAALQSGRLDDATALVDQVLLIDQCGVRSLEVSSLRSAYIELHQRRVRRGPPPQVMSG